MNTSLVRGRRGRRPGMAALASALAFSLLTGCAATTSEAPEASADTPASDGWLAGAGEEWETVLAAAREEGEVVLNHSPEVVGSGFLEDFTRDTGIQVVSTAGESSARLATMDQEARTNNLSIDVALGGGTELDVMYPSGLLNELADQLLLPSVSEPENWEGGAPLYMDPDGTYMARPTYAVDGQVVVNIDDFEESDLRSWEDLLDPQYRGQIALYDPLTGRGLAIASFFYDTLGPEFVRALYIDQQPVLTTDRRQLVEWVARGTYPIALGTSAAEIERYSSQGIPVTGTFPQEGVLLAASGSGVLKQPRNADGSVGPNPNAATVFINWYMSKNGQDSWGEAMLEPSLRTDAPCEACPDYVIPQDDREYLDGYEATWYTETRPQVVEQLRELLDA